MLLSGLFDAMIHYSKQKLKSESEIVFFLNGKHFQVMRPLRQALTIISQQTKKTEIQGEKVMANELLFFQV